MQKAIGPVLFILLSTAYLEAFCGFYVAKADAKLFNKSSQVVLARDGDRTVLTMANDFHGTVKDFAIVVPVPVFLRKDQIHVGDPKIIERLDVFSAPRLVEYYDADPCLPTEDYDMLQSLGYVNGGAANRATSLGVKIEAQYTVGEYDILILSANESSGLATWLAETGYRIPEGGSELLQPYIKQKMKFFVAKVNLKEFEKSGFEYLRPLQMAYESPKFMLPIRLGMMNAEQEQDLIVYVLSPKGRAEVTNYRTLQIPTDAEIPEYVKADFSNFYRILFSRAYENAGRNAIFIEYAWDMAWCDPCASDPLSIEELKKAGVFWSKRNQRSNVYLTRLHVRYSRNKFPEDLTFQITPNRENFQGRYILTHPFEGQIKCEAAGQYPKQLKTRREKEARTLARLTGWDLNAIRKKMGIAGTQTIAAPESEKSWWREIFE